jgi:hypothetical protein
MSAAIGRRKFQSRRFGWRDWRRYDIYVSFGVEALGCRFARIGEERMKRVSNLRVWIVLAGLFLPYWDRAMTPDGPQLPSAQEVMRKALDRAQWAETNEVRSRYTFTLRTVTEEFDRAGHLKGRKDKVYQARLNAGWTQLKLIKINGENLSPADLSRLEARERRERQRITMNGSRRGSDRRENLLTPELVAKYYFRVLGEETVNGRPSYLLSFQPKIGDLPVKQAPDRLLNQLAGRLWIDEQEFEIARAEVQLQGEVNLWAGIIASLKKMAFTVVRTRLEDGVWFNQDFQGVLAGRRLIEAFDWRTQSLAGDFHKASAAPSTEPEEGCGADGQTAACPSVGKNGTY